MRMKQLESTVGAQDAAMQEMKTIAEAQSEMIDLLKQQNEAQQLKTEQAELESLKMKLMLLQTAEANPDLKDFALSAVGTVGEDSEPPAR